MSPVNPFNYFADVGLVNSEKISQLLRCYLSSAVHFSDQKHLSIREFRRPRVLALKLCGMLRSPLLPSFSALVVHVVFVGSTKKVSRKYAVGDIAVVKDKQTDRNWTYVHDVGEPVGVNSNVIDAKISIPVRSLCGTPKPTAFRFFNLRPESFNHFWRDKFRVFCNEFFSEVHTFIMNFVSAFQPRSTAGRRDHFGFITCLSQGEI